MLAFPFIKSRIARTSHPLKFESKNPLHIRDTYNCDYLPHIIFRFCSIDLQLNKDFLSQFCVFFFCFFFYRKFKSPGVAQRSVSQENAFKKSKSPSAFFFHNTMGSNNSFTLIENNLSFVLFCFVFCLVCFVLFCFFQDSEVWIQGNGTLWPMSKMHAVVTLNMGVCFGVKTIEDPVSVVRSVSALGPFRRWLTWPSDDRIKLLATRRNLDWVFCENYITFFFPLHPSLPVLQM